MKECVGLSSQHPGKRELYVRICLYQVLGLLNLVSLGRCLHFVNEQLRPRESCFPKVAWPG